MYFCLTPTARGVNRGSDFVMARLRLQGLILGATVSGLSYILVADQVPLQRRHRSVCLSAKYRSSCVPSFGQLTHATRQVQGSLLDIQAALGHRATVPVWQHVV